jgi:hypothetical protein
LDNGDKVPPAEFAKVIGRLINPPVNCIHVICETSVVC